MIAQFSIRIPRRRRFFSYAAAPPAGYSRRCLYCRNNDPGIEVSTCAKTSTRGILMLEGASVRGIGLAFEVYRGGGSNCMYVVENWKCRSFTGGVLVYLYSNSGNSVSVIFNVVFYDLLL